MKAIDRIVENRRARKPYFPDRAYIRRMADPGRLLNEIEAGAYPMSIKYEVRRMYVVSLCAAFELYWRDMLKLAIDEAQLGESDLKHINKAAFSVADIASIAGRKVSLGELISHTYTFQSPEVVLKAFSEVFQIDAAKVIADHGSIVVFQQAGKGRRAGKTSRRAVGGIRALQCQKAIESCFRIRHETVHNSGAHHRLGMARVAEFSLSMFTFCKLASFALTTNIVPKMIGNILQAHPNAAAALASGQAEINRIFHPMRSRMLVRTLKPSTMTIPVSFLLRRPRKSANTVVRRLGKTSG